MKLARCLFLLLFTVPLAAAEKVDLAVLSELRREGLQNSKVEETLTFLTDVCGPRLTGSPGIHRAEQWARAKLSEWGLQNARLEPWEGFGRGWDFTLARVEMVKPYYAPLIAYPQAWTRSLEGPVQGTPVLADITEETDFERFAGKLKGSIVLLGDARNEGLRFEPDAERMTDEDLANLQLVQAAGRRMDDMRREWRASRELRNKIRKFLEDEGVAVVLEPGRGSVGTVFVGSGGSYKKDESLGLASFSLASEHYGRLVRLLKLEQSVEVRVELNTVVFEDEDTQYNVIADLEGSDPALREEVVLLGGHLDSWHAGTGATDNATGCTVAMEAVRLLKVLELKPRRTVRIALWGGEEQGFLGSQGYVAGHLGDAESGQTLAEHAKLSAYFNYDNGAGRIRGVYLQGNDSVRPIFADFIEPVRDLGVTTLTIRNTGGTDHIPLDGIGIPAFQFIQDPLAYDTRTHHSNMDVFEQVPLEDLKQSAVVVAWFVYSTAMRDEMLPRKAMPKPGSGGRRPGNRNDD